MILLSWIWQDKAINHQCSQKTTILLQKTTNKFTYKTNKFTYKTSKKLIYNHFHFYCGCSNIIMAIETEMFRLLFLCHERVNLMELYTREKELLIMFGSERRLDTHKRLQNAIPYMTDSLYKVAATALWNKLYNNICDSQYVLMYWRIRAELSGIESNISRRAINNE